MEYSQGMTVLHFCAATGSPNCALILLKAGADPRAKDVRIRKDQSKERILLMLFFLTLRWIFFFLFVLSHLLLSVFLLSLFSLILTEAR